MDEKLPFGGRSAAAASGTDHLISPTQAVRGSDFSNDEVEAQVAGAEAKRLVKQDVQLGSTTDLRFQRRAGRGQGDGPCEAVPLRIAAVKRRAQKAREGGGGGGVLLY